MPKHVRTLILGAGPTGLGAAWRLHERGETDWLLLEQEDGPGGAAATVVDDQGFRWDLGGHVIHSHFPYFDRVLDAAHVEWTFPERAGYVYLDGRFVPVPLQQNLAALPNAMTNRILDDISDTRATEPANLDDWFMSRFGDTLTDAFFRPFNAKMWAHPPHVMDHTWTSLRSGSQLPNVPPMSLHPVTDHTAFPYPYLGSGSIWTAVAAQLPQDKLRYGTPAASINLNGRSVMLPTLEIITYDTLISTIPLDVMLRMLGYNDLAGALLHSTVHVVGLGYEGDPPEALASKTYVYDPDPAVPFHRASVLSNYSPAMAGKDRWSILLEIGSSPVRPIDLTTLVRDSREALQRWGVTDNPVSVWQRHLPRGYPVPFLGRDDLLHPVMDLLEGNGVLSRGRFGGWRYESCNQDYSLMQGVEAVDRALDGAVESTYWPARAAV